MEKVSVNILVSTKVMELVGVAAYPIGVGTDVLKLVARQILGLDDPRQRGS